VAETTIKWLEKKRFVGIDSTQHGIVIAATDPEDGGIGTKPSDLLLLALGSCTGYDVVNILQKKREKLSGMEIRVTAEQQADPPWTFTSFHVHYVIRGQDISEKAVQDAIELSEEKYCSVSSTLRLGVPVTNDYEIINE
jgi:putative redox protein